MIKRLVIALLLAVGLAAAPHAQQQQNVGHVDATVFTSAARIVTTNSSSQYAKVYRGVMLTLDVTAASGTTPTLDVKLQQLDSVSGQWTDISGAVFQRITATGQRTLTVYPSPEGRGNLRSITGTDPAAGAEISETVPANTRWKLVSFSAVLATSAVVVTRSPFIVIDDGVTTFLSSFTGGSEAANGSIRHTWASFGTGVAGGSPGYTGAVPGDLMLTGGFRLKTQTTAMDAGDNYGAPQYLVEEYIGNYAATPLPRVWRAVATIAGTTPSFTFTLAGSYLP